MFLGAHKWGIQVPYAIAPAHYLLPHSSNSVMAKIVTAMQLPRMLKVAHCTVGLLGVIPIFFRRSGLLLFLIFMELVKRSELVRSLQK